jgi:CBS domain-containing protein
MKVREVMTETVQSCGPQDSLAEAARLMWEGDFGFVPVLDGSGAVRGVVTDRDACMASFFKGKALSEIPVSVAMSGPVHTCRADDEVEQAEAVLTRNRVRRLPVLDASNCLVGVISLNDIVCRAAEKKPRMMEGVADTLRQISQPRDEARA